MDFSEREGKELNLDLGDYLYRWRGDKDDPSRKTIGKSNFL